MPEAKKKLEICSAADDLCRKGTAEEFFEQRVVMMHYECFTLHHSLSRKTEMIHFPLCCSTRDTCFKLNLLTQTSGEFLWDCFISVTLAFFPLQWSWFLCHCLDLDCVAFMCACMHAGVCVCVCTVWYIPSCVPVVFKWAKLRYQIVPLHACSFMCMCMGVPS